MDTENDVQLTNSSIDLEKYFGILQKKREELGEPSETFLIKLEILLKVSKDIEQSSVPLFSNGMWDDLQNSTDLGERFCSFTMGYQPSQWHQYGLKTYSLDYYEPKIQSAIIDVEQRLKTSIAEFSETVLSYERIQFSEFEKIFEIISEWDGGFLVSSDEIDNELNPLLIQTIENATDLIRETKSFFADYQNRSLVSPVINRILTDLLDDLNNQIWYNEYSAERLQSELEVLGDFDLGHGFPGNIAQNIDSLKLNIKEISTTVRKIITGREIESPIVVNYDPVANVFVMIPNKV